MQDRYYLNNMSDAEITIPLSAKRVIKPHTSLPLNNKDVAIFKEMKSKRKDRISRFDALRLSKIPLDRDSNHAKAKPAEEKVETKAVETEVKTVEVKKEEAIDSIEVKVEIPEDKPEPKAVETKDEKSETVETTVEDKPEPKAEEAKEDKKEASTKDKEEEAARKALEAKVNEQFI